MSDENSTPDSEPIQVLLGRILNELPPIGKTQRNEQQGFNFRGVDDVLIELNPLLGKYGVVILPNVWERLAEERTTRGGTVMHTVHLHVKFRFVGPDGSELECSTWGEGTDAGDKATNKAMTGALKYALFQVFAIADATADSDRVTPPESVHHDDDPFVTTEQYERVKALVASLPKEEQPKVAGAGLVLGVRVLDAERRIVLRQSQFRPLIDSLEAKQSDGAEPAEGADSKAGPEGARGSAPEGSDSAPSESPPVCAKCGEPDNDRRGSLFSEDSGELFHADCAPKPSGTEDDDPDAAPFTDPEVCAGCGKPFTGGRGKNRVTAALDGKDYHEDCEPL